MKKKAKIVLGIIVLLFVINMTIDSISFATTTETTKYNTNYKPEFYGTIGITIKVGDTLDLKNSFYRILAKDFEDGNITKEIQTVSNNVDTTKEGTYNIIYKVSDSDGNETSINVPVKVINNGDRTIQRKIYTISGLSKMKLTGYNRGNNHDKQSLGIYLPKGVSVSAKQISNTDADLEVEFLNDDRLKESLASNCNLGSSTDPEEKELFEKYNIRVENTNKNIVKNGESINLENNVSVRYKLKAQSFSDFVECERYNGKSYDNVPFIITPKEISENPIIEITLNDNVKPLDYYTYGDSMEDFKNKWRNSKNEFAVIEGSRSTFLVPYKDLEDLGVSKKSNSADYINDTFNSIDDILMYYDKVIEEFDEYIGLSYNTEKETDKNVKTKYFFKADLHGAGFAYYNFEDHVAMTSDSLDVFLHNHGDGWCALHEIGHGYQGFFRSEELELGEVSNNFLAYYYQKEHLQGSWLGKISDIEKEIIEGIRNSEESYLTKNNNENNIQNLGSSDKFAIRLYAYVNLFNKLGPKESISSLYSYYREALDKGLVKSFNGIDDATDSMVIALGESTKYNIIPYLQEWKLKPSNEVIKQIYDKDYPIVYFLRDLVKNEQEAERIKSDLNLEGIYSLVSNDDINKYNLKGSVKIKLDENLFEELNGSNIILKSGNSIVRELKIDSNTINIIDMPIGIYEIECSKETDDLAIKYVVIKQDNTSEVALSKLKLIRIRLLNFIDIYEKGEALDFSSGVLVLEYDNGSTSSIKLTDNDIKVTGYNPNTVGEQVLTVEYKGCTTRVRVDVYEPEDDYIELIKLPNKVEYKKGEDLDLEGGQLRLTTNNGGNVELVDLKDERVRIFGYDKNKIGTQEISVEYKNCTTKFEVIVTNNEENPTEPNNPSNPTEPNNPSNPTETDSPSNTTNPDSSSNQKQPDNANSADERYDTKNSVDNQNLAEKILPRTGETSVVKLIVVVIIALIIVIVAYIKIRNI